MKTLPLFLMAGLLSYIPLSSATTYYVATTGNDSNAGTQTSPLRNIQKAADLAKAGDTVYVKAGTYYEKVIVRNSGTADKRINFMPLPKHKVTVDANGKAMDYFQGVFTLSNVSYVNVSGFRLLNSKQFGAVAYKAHHINLKHNYTYNTRVSGLSAWSSQDVVLQGNEVEKAVNGGEQECISVALSQRVKVLNNHVHHKGTGNNGGEGIDIKQGSSNVLVKGNYVHDLYNKVCLYIDAWDAHTHHITMDSNKVHNCYHDGIAMTSEKGGLLENIIIQNNISYNNYGNGLTIGAWGVLGYQRPLRNILVINNTFAHNGVKWGGGISISNPDIQNVVVRNNILSQNKSFQLNDEVGNGKTMLEFNVIDGFRGYDTPETYGLNPVKGSASFVNAAQGDYHLLGDSVAIDSAIATRAPLRDFDNKLRPVNNKWDMGAFEYQ